MKEGKFVARLKKRTGTFYRYAAIYFIVIFVFSGAIIFSVLRFSAATLVAHRLEIVHNNMQQLADSLENQVQTMENISIEIGLSADYLPSMLGRGPTYDLDLLKSFRQYAHYSPLSKQYFLIYRSSDRIFTSEGYTAVFRYYAPEILPVSSEEADSILDQILPNSRAVRLSIGSSTLLSFPIQFHGLDLTGAHDAALCFVISRQQLRNYIEQISPDLPGQYVISLGGVQIFDNSSIPAEEMRKDKHYLEVSSSRSKVTIRALPQFEGWQLLIARLNSRFYIVAAMLMMLIAALLAWAMAHFSLLPLEKLLRKYTSDTEQIESDFRQLDTIMRTMEDRHMGSQYQLRNHLLVLLLRGNYSEKLIERWSMLGIDLSKPRLRVFMFEKGAQADRHHILRIELEKQVDLRVVFYAVEMYDDDDLFVIANYEDALSDEDVLGKVQTIAHRRHLTVFGGKPVDSPKRLSLSFMSAITESRYGTASKAQLVTVDSLSNALLAAARSDSDTAKAQACAAVTAFLSEDALDYMLTRQRLYELIGNVMSKADEAGLGVSKTEINDLILLPDAGMIASDLFAILQRASVKASHDKPAGDDTSRLIVEYVIANAYDPDINLQDMSHQFGLSSDYISTMIKRETGVAFKEYLTTLRITEARRLLTEDKTLTINAVALRVGYRKPSNFSKKFKEMTGMLPSQLR